MEDLKSREEKEQSSLVEGYATEGTRQELTGQHRNPTATAAQPQPPPQHG